MVALILCAVAFFISIAFLVYRVTSDLSYHATIFQLVATGLCALLCFFNVIYVFTTEDKSDENEDEEDSADAKDDV